MQRKWIFLIIIYFTILLRLPTFFEPHWFADEGIYTAIASLWTKDFKPYIDVWINVPPGILLIFTLSFCLEYLTKIDILIWAKCFAALSVIAAQIAIYKITVLLNKQYNIQLPQNFILAPPIILALLTSLPFWEGNLVSQEIFMIAFITLGIYFILKSQKQTINVFIGGIFLGSSLLFKAVALMDIIYGLILISFFLESWKKICKIIYYYILGILFPLSITFLFLWSQGMLNGFVQSNIMYNSFYSTLPINNTSDLLMIMSVRLIIFFCIFILLWSNKKLVNLLIGWIISDFLGASLGLRPFNHYFLQLLPAFCLLISFAIASFICPPSRKATSSPVDERVKGTPRSSKGAERGFSKTSLIFTTIICLIILSIPIASSSINYLQYYPNYFNYILNKKSLNEYNLYFGDTVLINNKLKQFMENQEPAKVFILTGNREPWLYYELSKKGFTPALPYLSYFYFEIIPNPGIQLQKRLQKVSPKYIISHPKLPLYRMIDPLIQEQYSLIKSIEDNLIYIHNDERI